MGNGLGEGAAGPAGPPSGQPPTDPASLLQQRQAARERGDFATADALRDQLRQAGWLVRDTPDGPELTEAPPYQTLDPATLGPRWDEPDRYDVSVVAHVTGWPEDVARATRALAAHHRHVGYEVLLISDGAGQATGRALEDLAAEDPHLRVLHLDPAIGFGASMNLAMGQALGRVLVWLDPHVEPTGDVLGPLLRRWTTRGSGSPAAGGWSPPRCSSSRPTTAPRSTPSRATCWPCPGPLPPGSGSTPRTATTATPTWTTRSPSAPSAGGRPASRCPRPATGTAASPTPTPPNGTARRERTTIGSSGAGRAGPIC